MLSKPFAITSLIALGCLFLLGMFHTDRGIVFSGQWTHGILAVSGVMLIAAGLWVTVKIGDGLLLFFVNAVVASLLILVTFMTAWQATQETPFTISPKTWWWTAKSLGTLLASSATFWWLQTRRERRAPSR